MDFSFCKYLVVGEKPYALFVLKMRDSVNSGNEVRKSSLFRFLYPFIVITVSL